MSEDITKRIQVVFNTGLPLGTHATFTHNNELWIAYPAAKQQRIGAATDQLIGTLALFQKQLIQWLIANPDDADRVTMLLATIARADKIRADTITKKCQAATA